MIKTERIKINQLDVYSDRLKNPLKIISQNMLLHEVVGLNQGVNVQKYPKSSLKDKCLRKTKRELKNMQENNGTCISCMDCLKEAQVKSSPIDITNVGIF